MTRCTTRPARCTTRPARSAATRTTCRSSGTNLRARIPALEDFLNAGTVQGALTSVLGEDFVLHPHHFVHEASTNDQSFHQDGNLPWNDRAPLPQPPSELGHALLLTRRR